MSQESVRIPLTGLGKVHNFQSHQVSLPVAFAEAKLGAGIVEGREHDHDMLGIEG
jgi:hypothetical protein